MTSSALPASLPLVLLALTSTAIMLTIAVKRSHRASMIISLVGIVATFVSLWPASSVAPVQLTPLLIVDRYALIYMGLVLAASAAVVLLSYSYLETRSEHKEEFYLLLMLATLGSMVLAASNHMVSVFLSLELLSISLYALIAYPRREPLPLEAGIKYLVLAASSSAFLLFGFALVFIAEGDMDFSHLAAGPTPGTARAAYLAGLVMIMTGIGFKLAVVPFHLWTPDVYQGAPLPVTAFVATVSKGGVFAFLLRWSQWGSTTNRPLLIILTVIAITSMLVGNLLALRQTNIKRLLAYSSIAHMGYFFVAVVAGGSLGRAAATYYLAAYMVTILGAFGCLLALSDAKHEAETLEDVRGLFWRSPVLASAFAGMLLSLAGIPLTAGFLGKFYVFTAGASAATWVLIITLILSSTIGLVYYLRVLVAMFTGLDRDEAKLESITPGIYTGLSLTVLTLALFVLGVYPSPLWNAIRAATAF
jgi:NADH-quinone oxidoreductase subunit N